MAYTTVDNPELFFQTKIYTADQQANRLITLDGSENMQPDWVHLRNRVQAVNTDVYDSVRGVTKHLATQQTTAEATNADGLVGFNTDGFTVDTSWGNYATGNGYVAWCWKAGTSFTNDASSTGVGSIDSAGSTSTTAGFSIVSYQGTGSTGTIAHNLGAVPKWILIKSRDAAENWVIYHKSLNSSGAGTYIYLNTNAAAGGSGSNTSIFNNTAPTSSVFTIGTDGNVNNSGDDYIAYCFSEVKGYSKFGTYKGNGATNGPAIHTGFKPAFVLYKRSSSADNWFISDNKRDGFNDDNEYLFGDITQVEGSGVNRIRFLSNGFKMTTSDVGANGSGDTYIYMAYAESPQVNSKGVPNNVR